MPLLRDFLKRTPLYRFVLFLREKRLEWQAHQERRNERLLQVRELRDWERNGRPVPPPRMFKQQVVREHAQNFGLRVLVETETYLGEMVEATPIYEELAHILNSAEQRHVIIIDDARCFGTDPAYPILDELRSYIFARRKDLEVIIRDDSIHIIPKPLGRKT